MSRFLSIALLAALVSADMASAPAFAAPPPAKEAKSDPTAKRITGSEAYIPTFGLRAAISRGFDLHGVLNVDAGLDIPNSKSRKRAEALRPRVISAMRDAVLNYASVSYIVTERPDADMIRARIQKAVDGMLGKGEATVVLASVMVMSK